MDPPQLEDTAVDDDWEREEGVPSFQEPFILKYLEGRDSLIATEKKQRSGRRNLVEIMTRYER